MTDISHSDITSQFRDALRAAGVPTSDHLVPDGKLHRIHVDGDHRSKRNGWYVLYADSRPTGVGGCNKRMGAESIKWSATGVKRLSVEERRAMMAKIKADTEKRAKAERAKFAAAAVKANAIWNAAEPAENTHAYLRKKGIQAHGLRVAEWVRDLPHDKETGEVNELRVPGALLVPIKNAKNEIVSLQAIFPEKSEAIGRDKDFIKGGEKRGCYYAFGLVAENRDKPIVLAEGYATAASIHEATGVGCIVCFDAGNLKPVAEAIRNLAPNRAIIIAADDDQFTKGNPGVAFGTAAAAAVGGFLAMPQFSSLAGNPNDFNDLHTREGIDAVREQIMESTLLEPPAPEPDPDPEQAPEPVAEETDAERKTRLKAERAAKREEKLAAAAAHAAEYAANPNMYDSSKYFTVLGHDRTDIFVYSHKMKQIVWHGMAKWSKHAMLTIAGSEFWKLFSSNPDGNEKPNWDFCEEWLINEAQKKGFYDPSKTRGRGAWLDKGRIVYHFGNMMMVDGVETDVGAMESKYVYEQGVELPPPSDEALSDYDGRRVCDISKRLHWAKPGSAVLFAGFIALAAICGGLKWRPHIWITGGKGTGKSTALGLMSFLLHGSAVFGQGNSTEPGFRGKLKTDALPVMFDEAEQSDDASIKKVQEIIGLARASSSESDAKILKGTANGGSVDYMARSMFCFSSIQVFMKKDSDRSRFAVLAFRGADQDGVADPLWPQLEKDIAKITNDEEFSSRLTRRQLDLLPTTLANIKTFRDVARRRFPQREADQYGTLVAGAWSLCSSALVTEEKAEEMLNRYDWSEYIEHTESDDSHMAVSALLESTIILPRGERYSVSELINVAAGMAPTSCILQAAEAERNLRQYGMSVRFEDGTHKLLTSNTSSKLAALLKDTPYSTDFLNHLKRYKHATKYHKNVSFAGLDSRCLAISIEHIAGMPRVAEPELQPYQPPGDDDVPF